MTQKPAAWPFDETKMYYATQGLAILALIGAVVLGLLPALLAGFLVYQLVHSGSQMLARFGIDRWLGKLLLFVGMGLMVVFLIYLGIGAIFTQVTEGPESFVALMQKLADVVAAAKNYMPLWAVHYMPENINDLQSSLSEWLRQNAQHFSVVGKNAGVSLVRIIIGMIIGGMIALNPLPHKKHGPLTHSIAERVAFFSGAFRSVVFSQVRIAALNTLLTAFFLVVIMPLLGSPLPLTKTMIAVTFIAGLLPIIGNLISNTAITLISLSVSPVAAVEALIFLIVIHKLEYFVNARIIGSRIHARAWEILIMMVVMETCFGIAGMVAAPIYYAYIKSELSHRKLI